jgi:hypothetical protein
MGHHKAKWERARDELTTATTLYREMIAYGVVRVENRSAKAAWYGRITWGVFRSQS